MISSGFRGSPRNCAREKMSGKRFLGTASLLFGLLALLCATPVSPARAGGAGDRIGKCPPEGQPTCGDPINPATGNLYEEVTDFTTVGQNPLAVTRIYNTGGGGSFGSWKSTYDLGLTISPTQVEVARPDGKLIFFFPNGSGGWRGLGDLDLRLTQSGRRPGR